MPVFKIKKDKPKLSFGVKGDNVRRQPSPVPSSSNRKRISTPRVTRQTGRIKDVLRDASRKAKLPGKRISKNGKVYYETRRNRSDAFRSNL
tara:strand:- start:9739 stop:10011 length:273 start_codon:yes stop_codon:yes gene_type:complete